MTREGRSSRRADWQETTDIPVVCKNKWLTVSTSADTSKRISTEESTTRAGLQLELSEQVDSLTAGTIAGQLRRHQVHSSTRAPRRLMTEWWVKWSILTTGLFLTDVEPWLSWSSCCCWWWWAVGLTAAESVTSSAVLTPPSCTHTHTHTHTTHVLSSYSYLVNTTSTSLTSH